MTNIRVETAGGDLLGEVEINSKRPLLGQLEQSGIDIPNACRTGMCGACLCTAVSGDVNLNKSLRGEPAFPLGEGEIMTCIGGVEDTGETITLQTMS